MVEGERKLDATTEAWFKNQPTWLVVSLLKCEKCGLFYKDSLGHKCEVELEEAK